MSFDLKIWDADGKVRFSSEHRVMRHIGTYSVTTTSDQYTLTFTAPEIGDDTAEYIVQTTLDGAAIEVLPGQVKVHAPVKLDGSLGSKWFASTHYIHVFRRF